MAVNSPLLLRSQPDKVAPPLLREHSDALGRAVAEFAPSLTVIGVFMLAGYGMGAALGGRPLMSLRWVAPVRLDFALGALYLTAAAIIAHRWAMLKSQMTALPPRAGWRAAFADCLNRTLTPDRVARLVVTCIAVSLLFAVYGSWKTAIPRLTQFEWDARIAHGVEPLIGGAIPALWLQSVLGHPWITLILDRVYASLFLVILGVVLWQSWQADAKARAHFFLSFTLTWLLLGVVAAMCFPAAGPCYYAHVAGGSNPYSPLLNYLGAVDQRHPLIALQTQRLLWTAYKHNVATTLTGIAAFPSLHVGSTVLFMLAGFRRHPWLGAAFAGYALVIWIGSIHLGWHYAVDGYASALGVTTIWIATGRAVAARTLI